MNDKLKTFFSGAVPGYFAGMLLLFNDTMVGQMAVITILLKVFMAFTLSAATGMGTLVGKSVYSKIKEIISKRKKIKNVKRRQENERRRA